MDEGGVWRSGEENIAGVAERYYTNLFSTSNLNTIDDMLESVEAVITEDMNQSLLLPFNGDEVCKVLFQMHPSKSPGPNGMSLFFFQKFWHIVGDDVTEAILSMLNSGHFLRKMDFTHILLIPKKKEPQSMSDYRPISLSNVISRLASKVLANRVKTILPNIISDAQTAFVPDSLITENIFVAYEILHRLRNRRKGKTYDSET